MNERRFKTREEFVRAAADDLLDAVCAESDTPFAVMLSGGRTPQPIYAAVAARGCRAAAASHVLFSDERMVPLASPENNCHNAQAMLDALGIPPERVLRVDTRQPPEKAARDYSERIEAFFRQGGRISLGWLGLGADGHTASLFSAADVEAGGGAWAMATRHERYGDRVSVTASLLARVERVTILAAGEGKHAVIRALLERPSTVTAGLAVRRCLRVELWIG